MPAVPTFAELYAVGQAEVQSRHPGLTDWNPGSVNDAFIGGAGVMVGLMIQVVLDAWKAKYIDTAEGADLDALLLDLFNLERTAAAGAVGTLTFSRGSGVGTVTIPAGTRVSGTVQGVTVQVATDEDADLTGSSVDVLATAVETGTGGNVAVGVLTTLDDAVPADPGLTVTNAARFVGGSSAETDAAFRSRGRAYFGSLRRGTVAALETGALGVPGVRYVTVDESFIAPEDGGYVAVYVGDPDGRGNAALAAAVADALEAWRAAGIHVQVFAASRDEISLSLQVFHRRGADTTTLRSAIKAAVLAYTDSLAAGGTLYESKVESVVHALGDDIVSVAQITPAGDYTPSEPSEAVRVLAADLTVELIEEE